MGGKGKHQGGDKKKTRLDAGKRPGTFLGFSKFAAHDDTNLSKASDPANSAGASLSRGCGPGLARPSAVYTGGDTDLMSIFQKMKKKDPTTKTKALELLRHHVNRRKSDTLQKDEGKYQPRPRVLSKYEVITALNHFAFLFHNTHSPPGACLCYDNSFSVRSQALRCWSDAVNVAPKAVRALLLHNYHEASFGGPGKGIGNGTGSDCTILGVVWCMRSDPIREVSLAARAMIELVFRKECLHLEKEGNLDLARGAIISHVNYIVTTPRSRYLVASATGSGVGGVISRKSKICASRERGGGSGGDGDRKERDEEQRRKEEEGNEEERYERTVVSALDATATLYQRFPEEAEQDNRGKDAQCLMQSASAATRTATGITARDGVEVNTSFRYGEAFAAGVPWKHIGSQRGSFRRATYRLVTAAVADAPSVFESHPSIKQSLPTAFSSERNLANHQFLFEAAVLFLSGVDKTRRRKDPANMNGGKGDNDCDVDGDDSKWHGALSKSICKQLRKACFGSPGAQWAPMILPLLANMPMQAYSEGGGHLFYQRELLTSLWEGHSVAVSIADQFAIATAMSEGSVYLLLRRSSGMETDDEEEEQEANEALEEASNVGGFFLAVMEWFLRGAELVPVVNGGDCTDEIVSVDGRRDGDGEGRKFLVSLARGLQKLDETWQKQVGLPSPQERLLYENGGELWERVNNVIYSLAGVKGGVTTENFDLSSRKDVLVEDIFVRKLTSLLCALMNQAPPASSTKGIAMVSDIWTLSSLVPGLRGSFFSIMDIYRTRSSGAPTGNELELLALILIYCGVLNIFTEDSSLELDVKALSTAAPNSQEASTTTAIATATATATATNTDFRIRTFCMNDLLRWTLLLGTCNFDDNVSRNKGGNTRDTMVRWCFVALKQCLGALKPPVERELWEAFLRELIATKCHLGTFSICFQTLSASALAQGDDGRRQGRVHGRAHDPSLREIIPCPTLDKFATDVGTTAEELRRMEVGNQSEENLNQNVWEHYEVEMSTFLRECAGLSSFGTSVLVGPNVVQYWIDTCVGGGDTARADNAVGTDILLEILLSLALTGVSETCEKSAVQLALEAWRRGGRVWELEGCALLLGTGASFGNFSLPLHGPWKDYVSVLYQVLLFASKSLKDELQTAKCWNAVGKGSTLQTASSRWAHKARRLVDLNEDAAKQFQPPSLRKCSTQYTSNSTPLELVGLGDIKAWKAARMRTREDNKGNIWMWFCLVEFLSLFETDVEKRAVLLGNDVKDDVCLFVEMLLSPLLLREQGPSYTEPLEGKAMIMSLGGKNGLTDVFLELCLEETIRFISQLLCLAKNATYKHVEESGDEIKLCVALDPLFVGSGLRLLDLLSSCLLGTIKTPPMETDKVDGNNVREGDTLWYVVNENDNDANMVKVSVVKVHSDDYPNLYFTIRECETMKERQTITSRLKKYSNSPDHPDQGNYGNMEKLVISQPTGISQLPHRLQGHLVNDIVKPFFQNVCSADSSAETPTFVDYAVMVSEALNIAISRCGFTGDAGVGSTRYDIFRLISSLERQIVHSVKCRQFRSISVVPVSLEDNMNELDRQIGRMSCETAMRCFALAMGGGVLTQESVSNYQALDYDPRGSVIVVCALYEDHSWLDKSMVALYGGEGKSHIWNIHASSLLWSASVVRGCRDISLICRLSRAMNEMISRVSVLVKEAFAAENSSSSTADGLLILRAVCNIQDQAKQVDKSMLSSLHLASSSELLWFFAHVWRDEIDVGGPSAALPSPWYDAFSSFVKICSENSGFLAWSKDHADSICGTLFSRRRRFLGYQLLRIMARDGFTEDASTASPLHSHEQLSAWLDVLPPEEAEELLEDINLTAHFLPKNLMEEVDAWSGTGVSTLRNNSLSVADVVMGKFLAWLVLLDFLEFASTRSARNRGSIISYIQHTGGGKRILDLALEHSSLNGSDVTANWISCTKLDENAGVLTISNLAALVVFRTVQSLPTLAKSWWNEECCKPIQAKVKQFVENEVAPETLRRELDRINSADLGDIAVTGSCVSREVMATYVQDECKLSVTIRIPTSFPLRNVEVDCGKTLGVAEKRWRRWSFQIMMMLNNEDGSIYDALMLWKENVDKEFDGVEPCPVCYSVICVKTHTTPNLECKTCNNRFHSSCLYKWFHSSGKSQCVLCQQPWSGARV